MTALTKEIHPHLGMPPIKFGMTKTTIETILGKPELIEEENYIKGLSSQIYLYTTQGFELSFSSEDNYLLSSIHIEEKGFLFDKVELIGLTEEEFFNIIDDHQLSDVVLDSEGSDEWSKVYFSDKNSMMISFSDGELTDLSYFCEYNNEGRPIWPK